MHRHGFYRNILILLALGLILSADLSPAQAAVFEGPAHSNPLTGALRTTDHPRGSCGQCHTNKSGDVAFPKGLWRENDNDLCYTCHPAENFSGVYPGREGYEISSHNTDPRFVWPGPFPPARRELDIGGKCINCHNPHGREDRLGIIPGLMIAREETLCLACHDGEPSTKDIAREIRKPYSHRNVSSRHTADEGGDPDRYSYLGGNRHVECSDCHNAHVATGDPFPPTAPEASLRNSRVGRVRVMNGGPGFIPRYEYVVASDSSLKTLEYEICYKCHSSWTQQPPGQQDIASLLNPNNVSFHPVEEQGKNLGINPDSFVGGMNVFNTIYCSDCHGSDDSDLRGPHGSRFPNILKGPYETRSSGSPSSRDDLCFICHSFDTYADPAAAAFQQEASRFNKHVFHVGQQNISCYSCHESHGSPRFGALIVTGRFPGINSFNMTTGGGSCLPTCHDSKSYVVNYPR